MSRLTVFFGVSACLAGCGGPTDLLIADFNDELVAAAGRSVSVAIVDSGVCAELATVSHGNIESISSNLVRHQASFPLNPEEGLLSDVESELPFAVDVSVLGEDGQQIGRGCTEFVLSGGQDSVQVDLRALPDCGGEWSGLSVSLVLDRSIAARNASISLEEAVVEDVVDFVQDFQVAGGVNWSLVTHGTEPPAEIVSNVDATTMISALNTLPDYGGESQHYAAISLAAQLARARAVCPTRPVVLWIGGGGDTSPDPSALLATVGLAGVAGDLNDDLYIFAVPISETARTSILILLDNLERREVEGAGTRLGFQGALRTAKFTFQALVAP